MSSTVIQLLCYDNPDGTGKCYFLTYGKDENDYFVFHDLCYFVEDAFGNVRSGFEFICKVNKHVLRNGIYRQISEEEYDAYMQLPRVRSYFINWDSKKPTIDDMYSSVSMSYRTKENTKTFTTIFEPERGPLDTLIIEVFRKIYKIKTKVKNKLCFLL